MAMALTFRYKVDHHLYVKTTGDAAEKMTVTPLSPFSRIVVDVDDDITVRQGNLNAISWSRNEGVSVNASGDSLVIHAAGGGSGLSNATITVQNLSGIRLMRSGGCAIIGFRGDSLSVSSEKNENDVSLSLDSSNLKRLHLVLSGQDHFDLSNSTVSGLWVDMKGESELSLVNAHVGWVLGNWGGPVSLKVDSATLQNGIQKIQKIGHE